jgi:hypothetical protein
MLTQAFQSETSALVVIDRADRWGVLVSILCMMHCLALPVAMTSIPVFVVAESSTAPFLQVTALFLSSLLAIKALRPGYQLHRSRSVVALAIAGVTLQMVAAWMQSCECRSLTSIVHSPNCPCREACSMLKSECQYAETTAPVATPTFFSTSWLSPSGAILLFYAHLRNWQLRRAQKLCKSGWTAPGS